MNNKILYVIIVILLLVIVGGAAYFIGNQRGAGTNTATQPAGTTNANPAASQPLSEEPDTAKFSEYFSNINLEKLPAGAGFSPGAVTQTNVFDFNAGDKFCTSIDAIKKISSGALSEAVYNVNTKSYAISRQASGGPGLQAGNNLGCEDLLIGPNKHLLAGKYEYKIYVDNVLVAVLPFEVK